MYFVGLTPQHTISVPEHKTLGYTGVDAKGAILKHPIALREAYEAGLRLVEGGTD